MNKSPYSASFTAGSLLYKETTALLPLLLSDDAELLIKEEIKQNNILRINSETSRKRTVSEIIKRTSFTDTSFWNYYSSRSETEQKLLLFYLCLKVYKLMFDFHFNVTVPQWKSSVQEVDNYLYQMELSNISGKDEFVDSWKEKTRKDTISVYKKILKDVHLLDADGVTLKSIIAKDDFFQWFIKNQERWFLDACLLSATRKEYLMEGLS